MPDNRELSAWCAQCCVVYAWQRNRGPRTIAEARCNDCGSALARRPQVMHGRWEMSLKAPARAAEEQAS